jgi:molecular chaperone GrpE
VTDRTSQGAPEPEHAGSGDRPFQFTDKRKVNPELGAARAGGPARGGVGGVDDADALEAAGDAAEAATAAGGRPASGGFDDAAALEAAGDAEDPLAALDVELGSSADAELLAAKAEAAEHLDALQRERASFTNYRNRSLRDQEAARTQGTQDVLAALLPVLDDIDRARQHAELSGPMAAIAEKLDATLGRFGIERFGAVGEEFDPTVHDALMHSTDADAAATTVSLVIEPGYRIGGKLVRAARVGVVGPE